MTDTSPQTVLLTGASSGIGAALARLFAADGSKLILGGRNEDALATLAEDLQAKHGTTGLIYAADLSDPMAPQELLDAVAEAGLEVDTLVNCAGFGLGGAFAGAGIDETHAMIDVNVTSLTMLTRRVLPGMIERKRGRILNVASTAAFQPGPGMAVYYATKAYVLSFSEALAVELAGKGVTVTTLCPGPTETAFAARSGMADSALFRGSKVMDAASVALAGYDGMLRGARIVIPGAFNRIGAFAGRHLPRRLTASVASRMMRSGATKEFSARPENVEQ